jgi:hypothetical protein
LSKTVSITWDEAVVTGPGKLYVEAFYYEPVRPLMSHDPLEMALSLTPAGQDRPVLIAGSLPPGDAKGEYARSWKCGLDLDSA